MNNDRAQNTSRTIQQQLPPLAADCRAALYKGAVYHLAPTDVSRQLTQDIWTLLEEKFGDDPRQAQHRLDDQAFFNAIGSIRKTMFLDTAWHNTIRSLIASCGFDADAYAFDPPRLRSIRSDGHTNARAKAMYYPHRDTWYGHPPGIITWWLPLHDCKEEETFVFHPDAFAIPVDNDSKIFDYDAWVQRDWDKKIGWQNRNTGLLASYPTIAEPEVSWPGIGFSAAAASNLLFAGCHLHTTLPQSTGQTRFSIDFRMVHLADHAAGRAAPNVDNASRGSALRDYIQPAGAP